MRWRLCKKPKYDPPYGWESYRQNLLLLYEDVGGAGTDGQIDDLIEKTKYRGGLVRPNFEDQWRDLNAIELRLFRLLDSSRLEAEMVRKFVQAEQSGLTGLTDLKKHYLEMAQHTSIDLEVMRVEIEGDIAINLAERRNRAIAYLEEMFVKYSYRHAERRKRSEVSGRLSWIGLIIFGFPLAIGVLYALLSFAEGLFAWPLDDGNDQKNRDLDLTQWLVDIILGESLPFYMLFVVMYSGIVGAFFSRVQDYVRKMDKLRWNEMDVLYAPRSLTVRLLVGAAAAAVVFFLIMGELSLGVVLENKNFAPWVANPCNEGLLIPLRPTKEFALLVVWSVIAGFSERLIPDRLGKIQEGGQKSKE